MAQGATRVMLGNDSFIRHASDAPFTVPQMNPFIFAMVFVNAGVLCNYMIAHLAPVQPPFTAHRDGLAARHVLLRQAWPRFDPEWCVAGTMDPRKVQEFRKMWKKDMKAALRELDRSQGSPDQGTKSQPRVRLEKARPHLPSPSEFPLDFATPHQQVGLDKAAPHLPSVTEFALDLAMKTRGKV